MGVYQHEIHCKVFKFIKMTSYVATMTVCLSRDHWSWNDKELNEQIRKISK